MTASTARRGRVLRTLAQLHLRTFETEAGIRAADAASDASQTGKNQLPFAEAADLKATILALHKGDFEGAEGLTSISIEIAQNKNHSPSISWFFQTFALLHALQERWTAMDDYLGRARDLGLNSNQERREAWIRVLGQCWKPTERSVAATSSQLEELRRAYQNAGQSWYAGILALILDSMNGRTVSAHQAVENYFSTGVSASGLARSYLFQSVGAWLTE